MFINQSVVPSELTCFAVPVSPTQGPLQCCIQSFYLSTLPVLTDARSWFFPTQTYGRVEFVGFCVPQGARQATSALSSLLDLTCTP